MKTVRSLVFLFVITFFLTTIGYPWGDRGHEIINAAALKALPQEMPKFIFSARNKQRILYLANEPDRWKNIRDTPLGHVQKPEHFLDIEDLQRFGLTAASLPIFKDHYIREMAIYKYLHPDEFLDYEPEKDIEKYKEFPGYLPYRIIEVFLKLKSSFSTLKTYQKYGGTADEIENAEENVIYLMGILGHYVGDGSQPLHLTKYHHGWDRENNPRGYTTDPRIHGFIDSGVIEIFNISLADFRDIRPAAKIPKEHKFSNIMHYLLQTFACVDTLYQYEKDNKFSLDSPYRHAGRKFIIRRLQAAASYLANLWYTAYKESSIDGFLKKLLEKRDDRR